MKWYSCLNASALDRYAEHLRVAVRTAIDIAGLEPHLVFDGEADRLRAILGLDAPVHIHSRRSGLIEAIEATPETPDWSRSIAAGAFLRLEIPRIETKDEFVLYTDCDVLFARPVELSPLRPRYFAAAPQHEPHEWSQFCSGVLLLNIPAMRAEYEPLMRSARAALGLPHHYDQEALNAHFAGRWDHLPLAMHWKPYWGVEWGASIVHFHGPKAKDARRLAAAPPGDDLLGQLYRRDPRGYAHFLRFHDMAARAHEHGERIGPATLAPLRLEAAIDSGGRALRRLWSGLRALAPVAPHHGEPTHRLPPEATCAEVATRENFDERAYLYANPDVAESVRRGRILSGRAHFARYGRIEGRVQMIPHDILATPANFDAEAYIARNPDVAFLIARGRYSSARAHFERRGRAERRRQLTRP
ncbi:hypothetical protein FM996_10930 [Methylosinus sporium]|uniref:Glycosyl transferase n=1 Tax=Methylosinus sporium TaxID=428 RepID=A0A549SUT2_METSR|nr:MULTISPECIES: hypothetical protein [Methylosinus]MBU3890252.1 hypothetical protein [Methylosinus sp. KRF6]TRL33383.1 hypothetical protein FM996_10930 [Methylosinus sporium]